MQFVATASTDLCLSSAINYAVNKYNCSGPTLAKVLSLVNRREHSLTTFEYCAAPHQLAQSAGIGLSAFPFRSHYPEKEICILYFLLLAPRMPFSEPFQAKHSRAKSHSYLTYTILMMLKSTYLCCHWELLII